MKSVIGFTIEGPLYVSCSAGASCLVVQVLFSCLVGVLGDTSLQRLCVFSSLWHTFFFSVEISDTTWSGGKDRRILFDVFVLFQPI